MIIDNVEALKTWLTKTLSPICDADPAALAKYVVALVKKDKPENELNDNLIDQLDVFLQQRTRSFVSGLVTTVQPLLHNHLQKLIANEKLLMVLMQVRVKKKKIIAKSVLEVQAPKEADRVMTVEDAMKTVDLTDDVAEIGQDPEVPEESPGERALAPTRDACSWIGEPSRSPAIRTFSGRSRSRSWSPQRSRSRSRSRGRKDVDSCGSTPLQDSDSYNVAAASVAQVPPGCSSPVPTVSNAISVVSPWDANRNPAPVPATAAAAADATPRTTAPSGTGSNRPRCRDYDEKGYCMRGDLCPYDHGLDPVIVEDVNLPNVLSFPHGHGPPTGPGGPGFVGPRIPPPNHPHLSQMGPRGPPPRPSRPVEPYPPEGYNPEAPAINPPRPPFWVGPRGPPRPNQPFYPQPPRQRDLVNVPTIPDVLKPPNIEDKQDDNVTCETNRTVIPPKRDYVPTNDLHKQQNQQHHYPTRSQQHQNFQPNYQSGHGRPVPRHLNTTLEVRKIPRDQNNIAKLNEHFGKFGVLKNIQVSFENDPEAALITFANHSQANTAYRSSEPVFNNRFIKVFWHREKLPDQNPPNTSSSSVTRTTSVTPQTDHRMPVKARLGIPAPNLLSLDNTVPKKTETAEKAIVFTTSMGHLTKTVFNPAAMKSKVNTLTTSSSSTTSTTKIISTDNTSFTKTDLATSKKTIPKKDSILKKVQKQRHELLTSYLQQQKILIKKYEDKSSPPETKFKIKEQIDNLTTVIKKLQEEITPKKSSEMFKAKSSAVTAAAVTAAPTANSQKTQKEILDTELELISKQKSGEDTTELRKKLIELTQEAAALGLLPRGRGGRGIIRGGMRMRGNSWARGGRGLKMITFSRSLDNRPKQIHVSGFESDQYKNIIAHFSLFCEVIKSEPDATETSVILTFKSRQDAEKAVTKCKRYKDKDLKIQWYIPGSTITTDSSSLDLEETEVLPHSPSYLTDLDDSLLAADDEDEEDEESPIPQIQQVSPWCFGEFPFVELAMLLLHLSFKWTVQGEHITQV
ncbi:RBM26 [Acanthosepion pharaonis]|uniref:RBM26 n=1 Tax=Acanthosepion pharaonis TaxID=158019 RepID=A0A812C1Y5_ACAPH|nr:RBM26 [Sepia pharaonis]